MITIFCFACTDVVRPMPHIRFCECGRTFAVQPNKKCLYGGTGRPLKFEPTSFTAAVRAQPDLGFSTFLASVPNSRDRAATRVDAMSWSTDLAGLGVSMAELTKVKRALGVFKILDNSST